MSKVQLFAVNTAGETILLQLSDESPLKVTLSVASLNAFVPSSYYSQSFKIPGQGINGEFFSDVFSVNGYSFDASKTAQAWINNDGFLFSIGNLNLKSVFINEKSGTIQYEVFFMGDTSDFSASVGNDFMISLDTSELNHELTYANVVSSWGATAGATSGFKNGNVLYPLIEWGYNYGTDNLPIQSTLSHQFSKSFTQGPTAGLSIRQLKPAVRVKWLWDKIFSNAGYSYDSDFINSNLFDSLYFVSDSIARTETTISGLCSIVGEDFGIPTGTTARVIYNTQLSNPSLSFSTTLSEYTAATSGLYSFQLSGGSESGNGAQVRYKITLNSNLQGTIATKSVNGGTTGISSWTLTKNLVALTAGEKISVALYNLPSSTSTATFVNNQFDCTLAPEAILVNSFFPPQGTVKSIDFIKGITKMFNLVFVPGRNQNKKFVIEPWVDWIRMGVNQDWTQYLDGSSDTEQHAPFLEQPRTQIFTGADDADFQNLSYQQQFKRNFMFYEFESGINLIKGKEETVLPFAPSPLQSIPSKNTPQPDWVFPSLGKLLPGDPNENKAGKIQPIQPKPRILFYNGLQSNPVNWYLNNTLLPGATGQAQPKYPLVSEYETFPPSSFTLDLTFQSKTPLWSPLSTYEGKTGTTLYTNYWRDYIDWIYDPYNRKKTVTMRLNPSQIESVRFNDKFWVKDSWYFINKISDYPVGECELVKVELIKVPSKAIPNIPQGASGPAEGECRSVAICNNNSLYEPVDYSSWTYADCFNNLRTITLQPQTCSSICMLYPNAYPLPPGWTAIPNGNCSGITPSIAGEFMFIDIGVSGGDDMNVTVLIEGATGGTGGTYIPMQYYNVQGAEVSTGIFYNVPYDYGFRTTLTWNNGVIGQDFVEGEYIFMDENTVRVANASYSGYYAGPISTQLPTGVTAADYLITAFIKGITLPPAPPGCQIWDTDADVWGVSTTIWNECPPVVWNTDPDIWNLSTTIWDI